MWAVLIHAPPTQAFCRMLGRFATTGRLINPDYARGVGNRPKQTYETLKGAGGLDGFAEIDNSGLPGSPKTILDDENGFLTGIEF